MRARVRAPASVPGLPFLSDGCGCARRLGATFGDQRVSVRAGHGAVNLADQLHVVEQGVEGVEVREAHHVGGAASGGLRGHYLRRENKVRSNVSFIRGYTV